jgi:hypothetical protein
MIYVATRSITTRSLAARALILAALLLVAFAAVYGFAAANTVPESGAGDGSGAISGYTVGAIRYNLNATDPRTIDSVYFTLTPTAGAGAPTTVRIKLVSSGSTFYSCSPSGAGWLCATTGATVAPADQLTVIAAQ